VALLFWKVPPGAVPLVVTGLQRRGAR
jgi:hypothetical protein